MTTQILLLTFWVIGLLAIGLVTRFIGQSLSTEDASRRWNVATFGMWVAGLWVIIGGPLTWASIMAAAGSH